MNLFEKAIKNKDLLNYALGHGEYFIHDREYGDHSVQFAYRRQIIPLLEDTETYDKAFNAITAMLLELIETDQLDFQTKLEAVIDHLNTYYSLRKREYIGGKNPFTSIHDKIIAYVSTSEKTLIKNNNASSYIIGAIAVIVKNGGLTDYYIPFEEPIIFRKSNNYDLLKDDKRFVINVCFYVPEEHTRSFHLLDSEIPEDHNDLMPLAADMRIDSKSYVDREIIPALIIETHNSEEE